MDLAKTIHTLKYLVENRANVILASKDDIKLFVKAAFLIKNLKIAEFLIENGCDASRHENISVKVYSHKEYKSLYSKTFNIKDIEIAMQSIREFKCTKHTINIFNITPEKLKFANSAGVLLNIKLDKYPFIENIIHH